MPATGPVTDPSGSRPSVFLSYARGDQKRALTVIAALERAGIQVWWDGLLEAGETFLPTTEAALESADAVVVLWSRTSVDSHWVRDEATRGRERGCLVPLSLDGSHAPLGFRQFQLINVSKWRGRSDGPEIVAAVRAITALAGREAQAPAATLPAPRPTRRAVLIGGGSAVLAAAGGILVWKALLPGAAKASENTIAVIPFSSLGDQTQAYFSAGLSEELRAALSRNRMLRIAAPTSSAEFRDNNQDVLTIAKRLGVAHVLRGSVRAGTDMIRVSVELVNGRDAGVDWSEVIDRKPSDVLAMQSEIAAIVSRALANEISAKAIAEGRSGDLTQLGGTKSAPAFDAYLRGKALVETSANEASDRAALVQFDTAVRLDPGYASALAARSKVQAVIANQTSRIEEARQYYDRAVASAEAAVKAAPKLAEAHSALGYAIYNGRLNPKDARQSYERSRELGEGDADVLRAYALYCAFTGRASDADAAIASSLALDPLNPGAFRAAGYIALARRDYAQTEAKMGQALALNPKLSAANAAIGSALYLTGRYQDSLAAFASEPIAFIRLPGEAMAQARLGNKPLAEAAFARLLAEFGATSKYQQAQVLAQWGQLANAIERLEQAAAARDSGLLLAQTDPLLDPIRTMPEFSQLLSKMGLA